MGNWTEEMRKAAGDRLRARMANMTKEERSAMTKRAAATRAKNYAGPEQRKAPRRKDDGSNLDELAQQMGFTSARTALIDMAVKAVGFASVEEAAMWAVKNKQVPTTGRSDQVSAAVGVWDDGGEA